MSSDNRYTGGVSSIVFEDVSLAFEDKPLFQHLSITIPGGLCTCILGPSGCGKSTLLRLISGAGALPHEGKIYLESGEDIQGKTAWMSQKDLLLPWFSLFDNILLGVKLRGEISPAIRRKAEELLRTAGLEDYREALPATLSGGMRQRAALLRTLMERRPILLMDEPFSALDALTRARLQELSSRMTSGATVVLVTHDPLEALRMAHRVLVLTSSPASVDTVLQLKGTPPRDADDPEIHHHFGPLLNRLMGTRTL